MISTSQVYLQHKSARRKPRIAFIGPMLGRVPGRVPGPAEELVARLNRKRYHYTVASSVLNRYWRLIDIVQTIIRSGTHIDILCLQVYSGPSFVVEDIASFLGRIFDHRIIMVLHGGTMPQFMARFPKWSKRVLSRADVLVTPSTYLAQAIRPYGFSARVIPNAIDLAQYPYRQRDQLSPHLIWLRAFHRQVYNPLGAMQTFEILRGEFSDLKLTMIGGDKGDGSLQEIESRIKEKNLENRVRLVPGIPKHAVPHWLSEGGIFLNTTRYESFGISVMEAGAVGLPIVTTNVGELPFLWKNGDNALLVPSDDPASMARAVRRILTEPGLAEKLSRNARLNAEQYSWDRILPMWESLFAQVMDNETCAASAA